MTPAQGFARFVEDMGFRIPLGKNKFYDVLTDQIFVRKGKSTVLAILETPRKLRR